MDHDKTGVNSVAAPDAMVDSNVLGGPQQADAEEHERQAQEASSPGAAADPELEGLALTSSITELAYALEAVSTLIFEIQVCLLHQSCACSVAHNGIRRATGDSCTND